MDAPELTEAGFPLAPTEAQRHNQMTLHRLAAASSPDHLRSLVDNGADAGLADATGRTPLHAAAGALRSDNVAYLLALSDVFAADTSGRTALFSAVSAAAQAPGHAAGIPTVAALLEAGADVNAADLDGFTVLMACAYYSGGAAALCAELIRAGARIEATDRNDWDALHWAANQPHPKQAELIRVLAEAGCRADRAAPVDGSTALHQAVFFECPLGTIQALIAAGGNVRLADYDGRTPAAWAAENGPAYEVVAAWLKRAEAEAVNGAQPGNGARRGNRP